MTTPKSLQTQVGGNHYKKYAVQPLEFAEKAELTPIIFCIFKYVCRFKDKNKPVEDLKKALHCIDVFLECGHVKPLAFELAHIIEFLSQFDKTHADALYAVLELQTEKTVAQANKTRNAIYLLLGDYTANVK
jgi:bbp48